MLAVDSHHILLRRKTIAHMRHVAQQYRRTLDRFDRQIVQFIEHQRTRIKQNVVFKTAHFFGARRNDQALAQKRVSHILRRQPLGAQRLHIQINLNLPVFTAIRRRHGRTLYLRQLRTNEVI